ncbi:MAG: single-stranded DNA-binding protein [Tissierellia bacterium]|nr:single-stranded DNA-binding protein [Tissierellia bacterium]
MNIVAILGRLTKNPEIRYVANNKMALTRFTVAVDRGMSKAQRQEAEAKGQPTADFISCVAFGKTAEMISTYFKKGDQIALEGRIQTGSYQDKSGNKRYTTDVVVDRFSFISNNNQGSGSGATPKYQRVGNNINPADIASQRNTPKDNYERTDYNPYQNNEMINNDIIDDDIPF